MANEIFKNVYLFENMTSDMLKQLSEISRTEAWNRTDEVFSQGDKATALYIIKSGSVRVHKKGASGDSIEVAVLGTGSHFGEMAYVDGELRSASVEVLEKSEIVTIDYEKLRRLLENNVTMALTFYRSLSRFLCGRLRISTNDLSFSREMNLRHF